MEEWSTMPPILRTDARGERPDDFAGRVTASTPSRGGQWALADMVRRCRHAAVLLSFFVFLVVPSRVFAATSRPNWDPGAPWAPLKPHSAEMRHISDLFWVMLV